MGAMVIATYRAKQGREADLDALVQEHLPALRRLGFATQRPSQVMRASDGVVLELFEWVSAEAVEAAHSSAEIRALWERFAEVCDWIPLSSLPEARSPFAHFTPADELAR